MSMPLIACSTRPRRPCWRVRANIFCHSASIMPASSPSSIGRSSCWMTVSVLISGPPAAPASPRPTRPVSVSISTSSTLRTALTPPALITGLAERNASGMVRRSMIFMAWGSSWRGPVRGETGKAVRDAVDVGQQLALQAGWGVGGKIQVDGVSGAAETVGDRGSEPVIRRAGGEDVQHLVRDFWPPCPAICHGPTCCAVSAPALPVRAMPGSAGRCGWRRRTRCARGCGPRRGRPPLRPGR